MEHKILQYLSGAPYQLTYGNAPVYEYGSDLWRIRFEPMVKERNETCSRGNDVGGMVFYTND